MRILFLCLAARVALGRGLRSCKARIPAVPGNGAGPGPVAPRREPGAVLSSSLLPPQIPIAVSGVRGMGFLMKHHIETGGQLPAKLSSLFIKVRVWPGCEEAQYPRALGPGPGQLRSSQWRALGLVLVHFSLGECPASCQILR